MALCIPQLAPETLGRSCDFLGRSSQLLGPILSREHLLLMCGSTHELNTQLFDLIQCPYI